MMVPTNDTQGAAATRGPVDLTKHPMPGYAPVDERGKGYEELGLSDLDSRLQQMHHRVGHAYTYWWPIYRAMQNDVEFAYEEQWDTVARAEREKRRQPTLSFHVLPHHINIQVGHIRESGFPVEVIQKGGINGSRPVVPPFAGGPQPGGPGAPGMFDGEQVQMMPYSDIMAGLIRDAEMRSNARIAYEYAGQHAIEAGLGWLRIRTEQPYDNPFDIELRVEHIDDRGSVMVDHSAEMPDFSDAKWLLYSKRMTRAEFQSRYPKAGTPDSTFWDRFGSNMSLQSWWTESDLIRVCEYYWKEPMKRTAIELLGPNGQILVGYEDRLKKVLRSLEKVGMQKLREKEVDSYQVKFMRCTATQVLEEPQVWPGSQIPFVPVVGKMVSLHGRRHLIGLIRYARDPIQAANYHISAQVERAGRSPHTQWLISASQLGKNADMWDEENVMRRDVLVYNDIGTTEGKHLPIRIDPQPIPAADLQISIMALSAVMDTIGQHAATLGKPSNETSGVAIQQRQAAGALGNNHFRANLAFSITGIRNRLIELFPMIYTTDSVNRIVNADGTQGLVQLNEFLPDEDAEDGYHLLSSIDLGRYQCEVRIAPSPLEQAQQQAAQAEMLKSEGIIATAKAAVAKAESDAAVAAGRLEQQKIKLLLEQEKGASAGLQSEKDLEIRQKELEKRELDLEISQGKQSLEGLKQQGKREAQEAEREARQAEAEDKKAEGEGLGRAEVQKMINEAVAKALVAKRGK